MFESTSQRNQMYLPEDRNTARAMYTLCFLLFSASVMAINFVDYKLGESLFSFASSAIFFVAVLVMRRKAMNDSLTTPRPVQTQLKLNIVFVCICVALLLWMANGIPATLSTASGLEYWGVAARIPMIVAGGGFLVTMLVLSARSYNAEFPDERSNQKTDLGPWSNKPAAHAHSSLDIERKYTSAFDRNTDVRSKKLPNHW